MSALRKLAEEIQRCYEADLPTRSFALTDQTEHLEGLIRSEFPELSNLLGELAVKTAALEKLQEALCWASGSPSFGPDGEAHVGWIKLGRPAIEAGQSALSSDAGRLAGELIRASIELDASLQGGDTDDAPLQLQERVDDAFDGHEQAATALLRAFPAIREEVERD